MKLKNDKNKVLKGDFFIKTIFYRYKYGLFSNVFMLYRCSYKPNRNTGAEVNVTL